MFPKNPGTSLPVGEGRLSRKRRSRKRLAFSQEVSDAKVQQGHAAPWRKSSRSLGVRIAQTGSEEHRDARRRAETTSPCNRTGSDSATRPPRLQSYLPAMAWLYPADCSRLMAKSKYAATTFDATPD